MNTTKKYLNLVVFLSMLVTNLFGALPATAPVQAQSATSADAVVLVNSGSVNFSDFANYIQPYLDHFGAPYQVVDIATTPLGSLGSFALIITGHRGLDVDHTALDTSEQGAIVAAVGGGTGLVNFDNYLSADQATGLYSYIDSLFGYTYSSDTTGSGVTFVTSTGHYITEKHATSESISTDAMTLAGIALPAGATTLVSSGTQPFLSAASYGTSGGRVVQWGSYDWMKHDVLGPLMGLDDLVWRSIVWAARKPFVLQGMPPFVTMRMDDTIGPLDWAHISNEVGFKPWLGIFTDEISTAEAAELKNMVDSGNASVAIHAFATGTSHFFYFDHNNGVNYSDTVIAENFAAGAAWHSANAIPISKYVVPHYYELGSNALNGLANWGIEFVGTMMDPGGLESSSAWMNAGPFRNYEDGTSYDRNHNVYYADTFPTDSRFFNCITEFRDADPTTHYEWNPTPSDIPNSIAYGTKWLTAGLDGMDLATLFSHEYELYDVDNTSMRTIMQGIAANLAGYNPIYTTMDYACQYARAINNTAISYTEYDEGDNALTVHFTGANDMPTKFYVFNNQGTAIQQILVDVPQLAGVGQVAYALPGELDHVSVNPNPASVVAGATQQFTALGYDAEGNPIPNLGYTWSAAASAGTITTSGLFTAGITPGGYADAVTASFGGISGSANVTVTESVIDHFTFDTISSPRFNSAAFPVTIRARDAGGNPVVTYTGTAALSDTTGTISPTTTGAFTAGVWTGNVTIGQTTTGVTISAADGAIVGTSGAFNVNDLRACPCSIWEGSGTPSNPNVSDGRPIEAGVKFRSDIAGYILGVQFYKGSSNSGTHVGHLWSVDGTMLAEAEFTNESASGWQQVIFATPVAVTPNTTYVASYFSPGGGFADTPDALHSGVDNAPVHALANGVDGANGVFRYDTSGFPSSTWVGHAPNYWADVIFDTVTEHSIFNNTGTPALPLWNDSRPIEVGTKFQSSVDGEVRAIRYYKGAGTTGAHTGHLWSSTGTLLATAEFSSETAEGWQEARLATPVPIIAGTTYVVSYFSPSGDYAFTGGAFANAVTRAPLTALANGADGPNGVFTYDTSALPATSGAGANFWVDVVFALSVVPDIVAPTITTVSPSANATGVNIYANITGLFSETLNAATVNTSAFELRDAANNLVPAAVTYNAASRLATLDPVAALAYATTYTATLQGGTGGITDVAGNLLAADLSWSFTTASEPPPPPDEGPGGPILVIGSSGNPFGRYYAEILRNEGFNEFYATNITTVNAAMLDNYDVVILGEMSLTADQVSMFTTWVTAGGNLIAMRPDKQLAGLLGLTDASGALANAYLLINTTEGPGVGLTNQTIQFHSSADLYTHNIGTAVLATLYSTATTATANPAVSLVSVGSNGGQAAAFTYDLARSVVYTRQGNPDWATQERDTVYDPQNLIRSSDKFFGAASFDPQPDWIDFTKIQIPQADEQQRLLANLIQRMNADKKPLPHFWYFPRGEKAVIVMTGDDHGGSGTDDQWEHFKSVSPAGCSVDDWECVRGSSYIYTNNQLVNAQAAAYTAEGFEIGYHFDTGCGNFTRASLEALIPSQMSALATLYPSIPAQSTQRTHCIAFSDWDSQPIVSAANGVRLDANYYYWPPAWANNRAGMFTGSGMIMRFAQLDGTIIDSYQAVTQMTDESGMSYPSTAITLMDNALGSMGYYGAFTTNMHTDHVSHASGFAIVDAALARSVPVVSGRQMLTWLDGRNGSSFTNLNWTGSNLNFGISIGAGANGLQAMLPIVSGAADLLGLTRDGSPVTYTTETIKGIPYAIFSATGGSYSASYGIDTFGPVVSGVTVTPDLVNGITVAWTTDEPSISRVDYGTAADNLSQNQAAGTLVSSHSIYLPNLAPNTTFYYRVTSTDEGGNPTVYPESGTAPLSFTTPAAVIADSSAAQFNLGAPGACVVDATIGDGAVRLPFALEEEFSGTSLPTGWSSHIWSGATVPAVSAGSLAVNGSEAFTVEAFTPGRSLEFRATFTGNPYQFVGLAGNDVPLQTQPWVMFGTTQGGTQLYARVLLPGGTPNSGDDAITLGSSYIGSPHTYKIEWTATGVVFFIDGAQVATSSIVVSSNLHIVASDYDSDTYSLTVDWLKMSPLVSPCTYTSRVLDAGETVNWQSMSWNGSVPSGAAMELSYRSGNNPDLSAEAWAPVTGSSPAVVGSNSRFIQYQAVLSSTNPIRTPDLQEITFAYLSGADSQPPTISGRSPVSGAVDVAVTSNISVTFNELMDTTTITSAAFRLRADGAGTDVAAVLSTTSTGATLDPEAALAYSTLYHVTVSGSVTDLAENPLGSDAGWSFTTAAAPIPVLGDSTTTDFSTATANTCAVDPSIGGGAVRLPLVLDEAFSGDSLPGGWVPHTWPSGSAPTVSGGLLSINGGEAYTTATYNPGRVLEFRATFTAYGLESVGFGGGEPVYNNGPWVHFGTGPTGSQLFARVFPATGGVVNTGDDAIPLGTSYLGSPHTYRIEWTTSGAVFYIDGAQVASSSTAITTAMHFATSDYYNDAASTTVDWVKVYPYSSPCSFTSRTLDAGEAVNWSNINWTATLPVGTSLDLSYRTGSASNLDGVDWITINGAAPQALAGHARYFQYRAALTTTDLVQTPVLEDVSITYANGSDGTAPVITNRAGAATGSESALITWNTNEPADSLVRYGTVPTALTSQTGSTSLTYTHSISLSGLTADTIYYYRVVSADEAGNNATSPASGDDPANFSTPIQLLEMTDTTTADFTAGTAGSCVIDSSSGDGAVRLPGAIDVTFDGTTLPAGWSFGTWATGGSATVGSGLLDVNGASARNDALINPGVSLEFTATFRADTFQHIGFGSADPTFSATPIAMFSTRTSTNTLYTTIGIGATYADIAIPNGSSLVGSAHRYRIDWKTDGVDFYVDGNLVSSRASIISEQMRVAVSDYFMNGISVSVDGMRLTPYGSPCTFASRVLDAGSSGDWYSLTWAGSTPAGTGVSFETRSGNTAGPDGSWSEWEAVTDHTIASPTSRYLQYRSVLSGGASTPVVEQVMVSYSQDDNQAPTAMPQSVSTDEDIALSITLTGSDPDQDYLTYTIVNPPLHGSLSGTAPVFTYTPALNESGADSFTFTVSDGVLTSEPASVTITVNPVNDAPLAHADQYSTYEDISFNVAVEQGVLVNDSDVEGSVLTAVLDSGPTHGTLTLNANGSFTYVPAPGWNGTDSFSYHASDGSASSAVVTVSITVNGEVPPLPSSFFGVIHIYDNPPAVGDEILAYKPGDTGPVARANITASGANLSYTLDVPGGTKGSASEGDLVTFMINGRVVGAGAWHSGTNVRRDLHPPQALPGGPYTGSNGVVVSFSGSANDWGSDASLFEWDWENDGTFDATGATASQTWNSLGLYTGALRVTDARGGVGTATFTVTISNANPVLDLIGNRLVDELTPVGFTAHAQDADVLTYSLPMAPAGAAIDPVTGAFTWTPAEDQGQAVHAVTVRVCDTGGLCDYEDFTITVNEVNVAPVLGSIGNYSVVEMSVLTFTATATDSDLPANTISFSLVGAPLGADIDPVTGVFSWTPTYDQGPADYSFSVRVCDAAVCDFETITVTVESATLTHSISLVAGWNLVSFNVHPLDTSVAAVLESIEGNYDLLYAWDATGTHSSSGNWLKYDNISDSTDTLTRLDETMGFWIHMTTADMLDVTGLPPDDTTITLSPATGGWNLVAYPSASSGTMPSILTGNGVSDYNIVYAYAAADLVDHWKLYDPSGEDFANDLNPLVPGWGYWISVDTIQTWNVAY